MRVLMFSVTSMIYDSRIQKEAISLSEEGYSVTILYVEDQEFYYGLQNPQKVWEDYLKTMKGIKNFRVFLKSRELRFLPSFICKTLQAIELFFKFLFYTLKNKYEVLHVHDLTPGVFGLIGKLLFRSKLVYDAHELEVPYLDKNSFKKFVLRIYESWIMKYADSVITVNDYIAEIMQKRYEKEINVIKNLPNYVPYKNLEPNYIKALVNNPYQDKLILYVGNLNLARGIDKVVLAMKELPKEYIFLIMGTGRIKEFKRIIDKLCNTHEIDRNKIKFIGPFPPNKVVPYLSGADISVMMYQANTDNSILNAPNKFYQSIMARVPVLASNNKSFPILIHHNSCGTVGETSDETNPSEIAQKIIKLIESPNLFKIKENLDCLAKKSSWEYETIKLINIYKNLFKN